MEIHGGIGKTKAASKKASSRRKHNPSNYKSGLEDTVAAQLAAEGIIGIYETLKISFVQPVKLRTYTPDFPLPNGIIVETKGRFTVDDRQKHLWIKEQRPELDIRFLFSNSNQRLYKGSVTTYAGWCKKHGFNFADKRIPIEWLKEK